MFADFVTGRMWSMELGTWKVESLGKHGIKPSTFALVPDGSVLVGDDSGGTLYRVDAPAK